MNPFDLDDQVLSFVKRSEQFSAALPPNPTMADARANYNALCASFATPMPQGLRKQDSTLLAHNPDRALHLRRYEPAVGIAGQVMLFLHGGGFAVGNLESHDSICADLSARSKVAIVALDYRLSPEHRYPDALDDVQAVYEQLCNDGEQIIIGGDSAGATLAVALCLRMRAQGRPMPKAQLLIYPMLHPDCGRALGTPRGSAPLLTSQALIGIMRQYLGKDPDGTSDPLIIPLSEQNFRGLPPAAIFAADVDPLRQDAHDYAARLSEHGVPVSFHPGLGLVHGFLRGRAVSDRIAESFSVIVSALHDFAYRESL